MAVVRELRRLFEAISARDWESARSFAEQISAAEAKRGNHSSARTLRDALYKEKSFASVPTSMLQLGLSSRQSTAKLSDVVLSAKLKEELRSLLEELRYANLLQERGFPVRRRILLTGPPGCGKSLTAQALANELKLPLFIVRFDSIIGALLGQTATHLRQLFLFAENTASVLLFDEIDALGKRRGNARDVGELDRIVIALMQELELTQPRGLIIATSNVPEHLDQALLRRFDAHFAYPTPASNQLRSLASSVANRFGHKLPTALLKQAERKKSFAEVELMTLAYLRTKTLKELRGGNGAG